MHLERIAVSGREEGSRIFISLFAKYLSALNWFFFSAFDFEGASHGQE